MKPIARLVVRSGDYGLLYLRPGRYVVGRGSDCDLILSSPAVSRRHAAVELDEELATLVDLGSRNGTRVNGSAANRVPLTHGAVLEIGQVVCVFEYLTAAVVGDDMPTPSLEVAPPYMQPDLTPAERRVLGFLLAGLAEKAIASKLAISQHTVHTHVKRIYSAFAVNTRSELLARFIARSGGL